MGAYGIVVFSPRFSQTKDIQEQATFDYPLDERRYCERKWLEIDALPKWWDKYPAAPKAK